MEKLEEILLLHELWLQSNAAEGRQAVLAGEDLSQLDLRGRNFSYTILIDTQLNRADLSGANLQHACLHRASLDYAYLIQADLSSADLTGISAVGADFSKAFMRNALLSDADLSNAVLRSADLSNSFAVNVNFSNCNMAYSILSAAKADNADFSNANIYFASLDNISLSGVNSQGLLGTPAQAALFMPEDQEDEARNKENAERYSGYRAILRSGKRLHALLGRLRIVSQIGAGLAVLVTAAMFFLDIYALVAGSPLFVFPFNSNYTLACVFFFISGFLAVLLSFMQEKIIRSQVKISRKMQQYKPPSLPSGNTQYRKMEKK